MPAMEAEAELPQHTGELTSKHEPN
uniref:Uncharacterized protein n=1 Tax=Arundo donax TaxID=35708 RepID=A0A0A9CE74_ARUDO